MTTSKRYVNNTPVGVQSAWKDIFSGLEYERAVADAPKIHDMISQAIKDAYYYIECFLYRDLADHVTVNDLIKTVSANVAKGRQIELFISPATVSHPKIVWDEIIPASPTERRCQLITVEGAIVCRSINTPRASFSIRIPKQKHTKAGA